MRSARILAALLDLAVAAACADAAALLLTAFVWRFLPGFLGAIPSIWGSGARDGGAPGWRGSLRRNLPLLVPGWNIWEVWPVLRDGSASRPSDRRAGLWIRGGDG